MKTFAIALTSITSAYLSTCDAFTPQNNINTRRTQALHAETLEGWKIDGILKPVNNFILIQKAQEQSESDGGILLSNSVSHALQFAGKCNFISISLGFTQIIYL